MMRSIALATAALSLAPVAALAQGSAGAGFTYNTGTHSVSLNVKNVSDGVTLTQVDITLPAGTFRNGTPSGGGACTAGDSQHASCTFNPPKQTNDQAFVLINTTGSQPATVDVMVHFSDGSTQSLTASPCGNVTPGPAALPDGTVGTPYSQQLFAVGGTEPYTFSIQGALPRGLTLSRSGIVSGTPTEGGPYTPQIIASDASGCIGFTSVSLTIQDAPAGAEAGADMAAVDITPGLFLQAEGESPLNVRLNWYVPVLGPGPLDSSGFQPIDWWYDGDVAEVSVQTSNRGPKAATFVVDARASRGSLEYEGHMLIGPPGTSQTFSRTPPGALAPGIGMDLIYRIKLATGRVTFTATVTNVSPADPNLSNNVARPATLTVLSRTTAGNVGWKAAGSGGDISGTATVPAGSRRATASAAKARGIEIAVVRKRGKRCSWLSGSAGRLQPKPSAIRCRKPVFLRPKGSRRWRYHVRSRPPKGSYSVLVRARAAPGAAARQFDKRLHNLPKLRIR